MRVRKRLRHLHNLPATLVGAEINRRPHRRRAHVRGLFHGAEQDLIGLVRIREQFVVVDLHQKRNFVRVFAGDRAQHAKRGRHRIAAALHGQLHDVLRVEIVRVLRETGAAGVLNALIHRQDGNVPGAAEAAMTE